MILQKKFEKTDEEYKFFGEFYKFCETYFLVEEKQEYWDSLMNDANELIVRYDDVLCKKLILAFIDRCEEVYKTCKRKVMPCKM